MAAKRRRLDMESLALEESVQKRIAASYLINFRETFGYSSGPGRVSPVGNCLPCYQERYLKGLRVENHILAILGLWLPADVAGANTLRITAYVSSLVVFARRRPVDSRTYPAVQSDYAKAA
ncbi:hypothetical protein EMIHUDRAFT_248617 [Emiliania huxleyi CCMP1516]|uniref:Uncharacterized protein n=2 Tax=Emiliania huxleyi TaxID=2903 RepID=A0A0D3IF56_EMIH1|nr:hypothetical protein EMIHUDRAFT_248617 [Emiliania huxleyi CCMP1516]EOD09891.1 hypothetical protein EMIHUDRAFT_248617 [Emiliania huxleyi CCMP1516]|eukprot:XP_005762320.1 hypothetical protein EMIHUDRAFT_248617 [Emiliania huxleyi CCMP1516]